MNKERFESCRNLAVKLVTEAGQAALSAFNHAHDVKLKADKSYVTEVDTANESMMRQILQTSFPDHNIIGEEEGNLGQTSDYEWFLDPLDGTSNFLFGYPLFGSMVALTYLRQVVVAAVCVPPINMVVAAAGNEPTLGNGDSLKTIPAGRLDEVTLFYERGKSRESEWEIQKYLTEHSYKFRSIRKYGCVASHLIALNAGQPFISLIINAPTHDLAPLSLLYKNAGMTVVNRMGQAWTLDDHDLIAFHPYLENQMLSTITTLSLPSTSVV